MITAEVSGLAAIFYMSFGAIIAGFGF